MNECNRSKVTTVFSKTLLTILIAMLLGGCGAKSNIDSMADISNEEGLVTGTVKVLMNGNDVTNKCALFFNKSDFGTPIQTLPNGFFAFDFPKDNQVLTGINYYEGYPTLPLQNLILNFAFSVQAGKTNYLGDIVVKWELSKDILGDEASGMDPLAAAMILGPIGVGLFSNPKYAEYHGEDVGSVSIEVTYNAESITQLIQKNYGQGLDLVIAEIEGAELIQAGKESVAQIKVEEE